MNHRILELVLQAGFEPRYEPDGTFSYSQQFEKFARLIVTQCLGKIENEAAQYHQPTWAFELTQDIKEHFGVEE